MARAAALLGAVAAVEPGAMTWSWRSLQPRYFVAAETCRENRNGIACMNWCPAPGRCGSCSDGSEPSLLGPPFFHEGGPALARARAAQVPSGGSAGTSLGRRGLFFRPLLQPATHGVSPS